jgi:hypothetical protein
MRIKLEIKTNKRTFYIFESLFESRDEIEKKKSISQKNH